jgi:hypothetical protein
MKRERGDSARSSSVGALGVEHGKGDHEQKGEQKERPSQAYHLITLESLIF